jgi:peptidoglycan L-alanyl-D-glutamate endopeptidase CwlK
MSAVKPVYSAASRKRLSECHPDLQRLFKAVLAAGYDRAIVTGYRGEAEQNRAYNAKLSKLPFPKSKHNKSPSEAVDAYPWISGGGISYNLTQCAHFAGFVLGLAKSMGINLIWGGDWNGSNNLGATSFKDYGHFELKRRG